MLMNNSICSGYVCDNGQAIPIAYFCDGNVDCSDGSDEIPGDRDNDEAMNVV